MSILTAVCTFALYAAAVVLVAGLARKIVQYARTPAPLKIPTTPAPVTRAGVAARYRSAKWCCSKACSRASKWTWLFGWLFHAALLVVLVGHLRYFTEPVWAPVAVVQGIAPYAGLAMVAGLAGLWARRFFVDRVRYISAPSDHLMLALLAAIGGERSLAMRFGIHTDTRRAQGVRPGARALRLAADSVSTRVLLLHLGLVAALMAVFPFSKLLHAPGRVLQPHPEPGRRSRANGATSRRGRSGVEGFAK